MSVELKSESGVQLNQPAVVIPHIEKNPHAGMIDLRSDTVTRPTPEMREAMAKAEVGDDVFRDDPTVQALEKAVATLLGKEDSLFVPSGVMSNLIGCMVHCQERQSEMILGDQCHIYTYEGGGSAVLGGIHSRVVKNQPDGTMKLEDIEANIRTVDDHYPTTRLICVENTHNMCGGTVLSVEYMDAVGAIAKKHNLKYHVDGARLCNAAVALKVTPARLVQAADTVSLCLSKGLCAPIGSCLAGPRDLMVKARRYRKMLGGGMRQAGVIAAAGLLALKMYPRLVEDHENTLQLAKELSKVPGISVDLKTVHTNIVFLDLAQNLDAMTLSTELKKHNVLTAARAKSRMRLVLHYYVTSKDVSTIVAAFKAAVGH